MNAEALLLASRQEPAIAALAAEYLRAFMWGMPFFGAFVVLRGFLAGRLLEEGLIARPDDRGDAVLHLAPPLISTRAELEEMCAKTEAVLADASAKFYEG